MRANAVPSPQINCLFHNSTSVVALLKTEVGRALAGALLIECGSKPALGYELNLETPSNYPGITGLLGGANLGSLGHSSDRLPAPIVLAAGATVSRIALRSAL